MHAVPLLAGLTALATVAAGSLPLAEQPEITHRIVRSFDGTPIHTTLFLPDEASAERPAPLVLRSHGWSQHGERDLSEASSTTNALLQAGYAVLTWDERGFGYSGGQAHVLKPEYEGRDASVLVDHVATHPEIAPTIACETARGAGGTCPDPVIGMTGLSYGGGIQLLTAAHDAAFSATTRSGQPRIDAIAPEITWNDLRYSLYDNGVINLGWAEALYGVGVATARGEGLDPRNPAGPQSGGLDPQLHRAQVEGVTTNDISPESRRFFGDSSLAVYGKHHPVAVPTLFMQGNVDTLFDLTEVARNYHHVREQAPAKLIAYCGGHVQCPPSYADAGDRQFLDRAILTWFDKYLRNTSANTGAPVVYRTNEGRWRPADDFPPSGTSSLTASARGRLVSTPAPTTAHPTANPEVTSGPLTTAQPNKPGDPHAFTAEVAVASQDKLELVGVPRARVAVSGTGRKAHLFLKLIDRESGEVVNLQEAPVKTAVLSGTEQVFDIIMPGIAYTLPQGHHLDLQVSTTSTMHATARTPAQLDVSVDAHMPVR